MSRKYLHFCFFNVLSPLAEQIKARNLIQPMSQLNWNEVGNLQLGLVQSSNEAYFDFVKIEIYLHYFFFVGVCVLGSIKGRAAISGLAPQPPP